MKLREFSFGNKAIQLFIILSGFFIANVFIAEFIGVKIFSLEDTLGIKRFNISIFGMDNLSFQLTAGVLLWPVVFIMTDVINEYFGVKGVRYLSFLAAGLIFYSFIMVFIAIRLSPAEWWTSAMTEKGVPDYQLAFQVVFGQGNWIIIGSLIAFLIGQMIDAFSFRKIKTLTGGKAVWLRATGSTLISQFIDSYVVLIIAFYIGANWDLQQVLAIGTMNYIYKFIMAVLLTPAIYLAHFGIGKFLGKELSENLKTAALENS